MKDSLMLVLSTIAVTFTITAIVSAMYYKNWIKSYSSYVETTENLLEELEIMCEDDVLSWGDTICEGDNWSDYIDACRKIRIEK